MNVKRSNYTVSREKNKTTDSFLFDFFSTIFIVCFHYPKSDSTNSRKSLKMYHKPKYISQFLLTDTIYVWPNAGGYLWSLCRGPGPRHKILMILKRSKCVIMFDHVTERVEIFHHEVRVSVNATISLREGLFPLRGKNLILISNHLSGPMAPGDWNLAETTYLRGLYSEVQTTRCCTSLHVRLLLKVERETSSRIDRD